MCTSCWGSWEVDASAFMARRGYDCRATGSPLHDAILAGQDIVSRGVAIPYALSFGPWRSGSLAHSSRPHHSLQQGSTRVLLGLAQVTADRSSRCVALLALEMYRISLSSSKTRNDIPRGSVYSLHRIRWLTIPTTSLAFPGYHPPPLHLFPRR